MSVEKEIRVRFEPSGQTVFVLPGTLLIEAAERAGVEIDKPCDGKGTCGKCRLRIVSGASNAPVNPVLSEADWAAGYRLACQTSVEGELVVELPHAVRRSDGEQILTHGNTGEIVLNPGIIKRFFRLAPPTRESTEADAERLSRGLSDCEIPHSLLKEIPQFLRRYDWSGTAILRAGRLIDIVQPETNVGLYGVAFDIGTTTIVGALFDLETGDELAVAVELNPQFKYGADVISRIERIRQNPEMLTEIQSAAIRAVNAIISRLAEQTKIVATEIHQLSMAGNSTMQEILLGIDPSPLGELPFVQAFARHQTLSACDLGIVANPQAELLIMPQIGGFVGGDTVAAMAAAGIDDYDRPVLMIDIGTNGEIVLVGGGRMIAASAAAGPALEGARIEHGMRAAAGAIEKVLVDNGDIRINVIGNTAPLGICGTALIDTVAELLNFGILTGDGRILAAEDLPETVPSALRDRITDLPAGRSFVLISGEESGIDRPIALSQKDVSEMQLAVGAIRAGTDLLLKEFSLKPENLGTILLAGAFGNYIRKNNALRIGLIPDIEPDRIKFIGNAALHGAKRGLLMSGERDYADRLAEGTRHIDLSTSPDFQNSFADAMFFPA